MRRVVHGVWISTALGVVTVAMAADKPDVRQGHEVFKKWCAPCHASGPGHPGTTALEALYNGAKPAALEARTDLTVETVKYFVRTGVSVMPFFRKTEISDPDLEDLAAYLARAEGS